MEKIIKAIQNEKLTTQNVADIINALPRETVKDILRAFVVKYPEEIFGEQNVDKNIFGQLTIHNIHSYKTTESGIVMNCVNLPAGH